MNSYVERLVRKDQASSLSRGNPSLLSSADLVAKDGLYQSFSDTRPAESADDETEQDNENGVSKRESETASSRPRLTNAEDASDMNGTFPTLGWIDTWNEQSRRTARETLSLDAKRRQTETLQS